ncbi:MAG: hypothetical protein A2Z20_00315 [Bdellovibrionales bacterium RBG_16_40_8]|nr:MAG: hypothetical protein A2Z20_00315 [Bdellovibrionales bacterium RBG_16_40_8]
MKLILAVALQIFTLPIAFAGGEVGNGGNACAMDFAHLGRVIYYVIKDNAFYNAKLNLVKLDSAINNTAVVVVKDKLYDKNGGLVPVKNDGVGKIYLSEEDWCSNSFIRTPAAIVLHEYLGISEPGRDAQYQLSGPLYVQTTRTDENFRTYLLTGSDFTTQVIGFSHVLQNEITFIVIESVPIEHYFNFIGIDESERYKFRAKINCAKGNEQLELFSIYAAYSVNKNPKWFYRETYLNTYRFNDSFACRTLRNRAQLIGNAGMKVILGLDSLKILDHY